ncbi:hypothetical protein BKP45_09170 [Anaerobacillus alkalidiazotrophicus]|uniref:SHOCT domain-containing protein n=1 Tax=Anaerobacillus alkalidiazotrophicus TaxID=472963 RepID=A0A1S2M6P3_9BACI|nr:hypothetical protein [Anaerobacillus alkalidiazotrophicus]OIJ20409.1 hypothetical protein BKP45_09170 [Anaerobacillus alkalidiazotrophicus]
MRKKFRGFALLALILLVKVILPVNTVYSESEISLTELEIKVMPEFINPEDWDYTIPSLLVGYHGTFTNHSDSVFNGEIIISVPTHLPLFKEGFVAQFKDQTDTQPTQEEYTVNFDEQYFSWTPSNPIQPNDEYYFVLEYFSAPIEGEVERNFQYEYIPDSDIQYLNLTFYAPFQAENFQINKEADLITQSFGVEIQVFEYNEIKQGEILDFNVSYKKDSIVTTVEAFNDFTMPSDETHAGLNQQAPIQNQGNESFMNAENIVMIILMILIIAAFIFIIIRKKNMPQTQTKEIKDTPKKIVNKDEEIKKLRKLLADGQIDERTYKEKRSKLD